MADTIYNLNITAREEIDLKLKELLELCQIYRTPMFASVAVANDNKETEYNNIVYDGTAHNVHLKDDKIPKYMLVTNGFEPVEPREVLEYDPMEAFNCGTD